MCGRGSGRMRVDVRPGTTPGPCDEHSGLVSFKCQLSTPGCKVSHRALARTHGTVKGRAGGGRRNKPRTGMGSRREGLARGGGARGGGCGEGGHARLWCQDRSGRALRCSAPGP